MKKNNKLVRNKANPEVNPVEQVQTFTINLLPKQCRTETLENRQYTVVPVVMLTEGVHNGSNGSLLYTADELAKTPQAWDHKPVVVYHPEQNGEGISACRPDVIETQKVGILLNTKVDTTRGRLLSEVWVENEKADQVDERVLAAVKANEVMEVSTGVFVDKEVTAGDWKGETYDGIARNFRPDHLALLPDQIGACSVRDGAGLLRNASKKDPSGKTMGKLQKVLKELGLTDNEMSFDNIRCDLNDALRTKYKVTDSSTGPWPWVADVYSNFVVYEYDGKLFRLGYTASDTGVSLDDGNPDEVSRVTEYRTVSGAFVGNRDQSKKATTMDPKVKKAKIDGLIANKDSGWSEESRPVLEAMKDATLEAQAKAFEPKEDVTANKDDKKETPAVVPGGYIARNVQAPQKPFDYNDWLKTAPTAVQEMVQNGTAVLNEEKTKLVAEITANKNNVFTEDQLKVKPLGELRAMAALARPASTPAQPAAYYGGQAPTANASGASVTIEPLPLPTMNFEPAGKAESK
jgi:hypothetical protein